MGDYKGEVFLVSVLCDEILTICVKIQVGIDTPLEVMSDLRAKMRQYVQDESRQWAGGLDMNVNTITNQNYIEIIVALQHKGNWQGEFSTFSH